ncbi:MAG: NAD(+) diphosphatase [Rhodovibrionaceae bacterium]|nr:NAD(+) diphosphatase [Rhodovibrionaceae bacterium]
MNFYTGAPLDRVDHLRGDEAWLSARIEAGDAEVVAVWRDKNLMLDGLPREAPAPARLPVGDWPQLLDAAEQMALLGLLEGRPLLAVDLSNHPEPEAAHGLSGHARFIDLRSVGPLLPRDQGAILAYARGLMYWHRRHRFCGVCGHPTASEQAGHVRRCTNGKCGATHFPRTDPAVIMLVHDGGERCVLGRTERFLPGMHSTLAGFVEPGESLEEAVAREVEEEVGLKLDVAEVHYRSSQPWPFPSSLMLGFHARADYGTLTINPQELSGARWFTREELRNSPEDDSFRLPRGDSIARRLIEEWLAEA